MSIAIDDIHAAARAVEGHVVRTPAERSETLSSMLGADVYLKLESFQFTGSFKDRGAVNRLSALTDAERKSGIVAMSAGNHAQAVARHASQMGVDVTIVMPVTTPLMKVRNTEMLGASVHLTGEDLASAAAAARALAEDEKRVLIHPYDDPLIIAGQGTAMLEFLADVPALDMVIIPIGGGGLISGCAIAAKALLPEIRIFGVEAALYPAMNDAIHGSTDSRQSPYGQTIAEGIAVKFPGKLTQPIVERLVDDILLAPEEDIEHAISLFANIEKIVVEGAGATPLAAMLGNRALFAGKKVGLLVSGGNIDARLLSTVLMRGLLRSGGLMRMRVELADQPGALARVTELISGLGGNIVEVEHHRWFYDVPARLTQVDFLLETRDRKNAREIVAGLNEADIPVRVLTSTAEAES